MNCEKLGELMELFILDETDSGERLVIEAHLSVCPACRDREQEYRSAILSIKQSVGHGSQRFEFNRNLQMAIESEIKKVSRHLRFKRRFAVISSIAACLIIGMFIWNNLFSPSANDDTSVFKGDVEVLEYSKVQTVSDEFIIQHNNMYMIDGSRSGRILAIDIDSGRRKWYADIEDCSHISADESNVYCIANTGQNQFDLIAMNSSTGEIKWRHSRECSGLPGGSSQPTVLADGHICWVIDSTIHLLKASNGKVVWSHSIPEENLLSSAAVKDHNLYISGTEGIYCLDIGTGEESWRLSYNTEMYKQTRPLLAISGTHLYASLGLCGDKGILLSIGIGDRKVNWAKVMSNVSQICVVNERLYVRNNEVQSLDRENGDLLWTYASAGDGQITYSNGRIYIVDSKDGLISLYEQSGNKVWQSAGMNSCDAFVKVGNSGYIRTREGTICKIILKG